MTTWRAVPGYEGLYEVSSSGDVRSIDRTVLYRDGRKRFYSSQPITRQVNRGNGYVYVPLCHKSKVKFHTVHSLVAAAFIGSRPDGLDVCHSDGDRENNAWTNLRYATRRENHLDKRAHMTSPQGERCGTARLTEAQVLEIRTMIEKGNTLRAMATTFGVAVSTIQNIRDGRTWAHLGPIVRGRNQADRPVEAILEGA